MGLRWDQARRRRNDRPRWRELLGVVVDGVTLLVVGYVFVVAFLVMAAES